MLKVITLGLVSTLVLVFPALADHHGHDAEIESAMAAAPMEISGAATVRLHDDTLIREGTKTWTCYPLKAAEGEEDREEAGCYNTAWMAFSDAFEADDPCWR